MGPGDADGGPSDDADKSVTPSRCEPRRRGRWPVQVAGDDKPYVALDLSRGGMFVAGLAGRATGDRFDAVVTLPDGPLAVKAIARWSRPRISAAVPQGTGVAFDGATDDDRARIGAAIEETT